MLSVDEALARVAVAFQPLGTEWVALPAALGRVLAEDVRAGRDQPPRPVSSMDGYAVRAADLASGHARLKVIGRAPAGASYPGSVGPGEAVRIFTGAALPPGTDAIALQEHATLEGEAVRLEGRVEPGHYVRAAGLDFRAGEILLAAGRRLTPRYVALAAAVNHAWLSVRRRPRIAVLATGDELVMPGSPLGEDQIVSTNALLVGGMVEAFGGVTSDLGIVPDEPAALSRVVPQIAGFDLLVTLGGASVGEHDLIRQTLGEKGLDLDFWRIAMRPGKPLLFGRIGNVPVLGLPGNPVSTGVCTTLFVRAAIRRMLALDPHPRFVAGVLGRSLGANDQREEYLRTYTEWRPDGRIVAHPVSRQDSSMLAVFAKTDALVRRPAFAPAMASGSEVDLLLLESPALAV